MTNSSGMNLNNGTAVGSQGEGRESPSIRAYPEYKNSGVEWLGEIPSHWSKVAIKFLATERKALFIDGDWIESKDLSDKGIRYITTGNVGRGHYKEQGSGHITEETFKKIKCTEVFPNDVLISRLNSPIGRACIVPDLNGRIVTSVDNVIFRPDSHFSKQFLVHLFSSFEYISNTENLARGATMQRISRGLLGNIRVVIPFDLSEQNAIASYLDRETARIDKLITEKQNFIKLLKEKRQALISHVVTKGLDADVKMKESGIEWIGEVPEHWVQIRLKFLVPKIIDTEHKTIPFVDDSNYLVARTSDIRDGELLSEQCRRTDHGSFQEWTRRATPACGDIIFTREAPAGEACIVPDNLNICLGQRTVLIRPSRKLLAEYLLLVIYSDLTKEFIENTSMGSTVKHLNMSDIPNIPLFCPDLAIQRTIVDYASEELSKIKQLNDLSLESINLLKEHRAALISAAVTGKIDVRDQGKESAT